MLDIDWADPPPINRTAPSAIRAIGEELKKHPGRWARDIELGVPGRYQAVAS